MSEHRLPGDITYSKYALIFCTASLVYKHKALLINFHVGIFKS